MSWIQPSKRILSPMFGNEPQRFSKLLPVHRVGRLLLEAYFNPVGKIPFMIGFIIMNKTVFPVYITNQVEGVSPLFPPRYIITDLARESLLHVVRRDPRQFGENCSRWTLSSLGRVCDWLGLESQSGVWRLLKRLNIRYKLGRSYIHSPDSDYIGKLQTIQFVIQHVGTPLKPSVILFQDEFSCYRQPTLARDYEACGHIQPLARLSIQSNTQCRIAGALDAFSGQVIYRQASKITVKTLVDFYQQLCENYDNAMIGLVQDNWPVHFHPDVLAALQPQNFQYPLHYPSNWPQEPSKNARRLNLPIQLLPLPTYASWCNPIEKLWRWLKQEVLHLHRYADNWGELKELVTQFLDQFADGSRQLLRYVGLLKPDGIYGAAFAAAGIPPP